MSTIIASISFKEEDHEAFHDEFMVSSDTESAWNRPHAIFFQPIFREIYNDTSEIVGYISALIPWGPYFANLLPEGVKGITCVASNTCGQSFTYYLNGNDAFYAGEGYLHDERYNHMKVEIPFSEYLRNRTRDTPGHCMYTFTVYPTNELEDKYDSSLPLLMTLVVATAFCFMILTFLGYDWFVQRRHQMVVGTAARANVILSTLFPKKVRDRLFAEREIEEENNIAGEKKPLLYLPGNKARLTSFLNNEANALNSEKDDDDDDFMYKS